MPRFPVRGPYIFFRFQDGYSIYMRPKGANPEEWPADLRVREMPQPAAGPEVQRD